jgi:hypothetical protein
MPGDVTTERRDVETFQLDIRAQNTLVVCLLLFGGIVLFYVSYLFRFYYGAVILILAYLAYTTAGSKSPPYSYASIVTACFSYLALSIAWSPIQSESVYRTSVDFIYFLFVLVPILAAYCTEDVKFRMLQAASVAHCCTAIVALLTLGDFVDPTRGPIRTTYGVIFLASIPSHVYLISRHKSALSVAALVAIFVIGLQLGNRTLLIFGPPMLLASIVVAARQQIRTSRSLQYLLGGAILALPFVAIAASQLDLGRAYQRVTNATSFEVGREVLREQLDPGSRADRERLISTYVSITTFLAHPLIGGGYGSSPYFVRQVSTFETPAHGLPFMLLGETGLVGTLLFSTAIYLALRGYWRRLRRYPPPDERSRVWFELLTLSGVLLIGVAHQIYEDIYFFIFLGTGLYYGYCDRRRAGVVMRTPKFSPAASVG